MKKSKNVIKLKKLEEEKQKMKEKKRKLQEIIQNLTKENVKLECLFAKKMKKYRAKLENENERFKQNIETMQQQINILEEDNTELIKYIDGAPSRFSVSKRCCCL